METCCNSQINVGQMIDEIRILMNEECGAAAAYLREAAAMLESYQMEVNP